MLQPSSSPDRCQALRPRPRPRPHPQGLWAPTPCCTPAFLTPPPGTCSLNPKALHAHAHSPKGARREGGLEGRPPRAAGRCLPTSEPVSPLTCGDSSTATQGRPEGLMRCGSLGPCPAATHQHCRKGTPTSPDTPLPSVPPQSLLGAGAGPFGVTRHSCPGNRQNAPMSPARRGRGGPGLPLPAPSARPGEGRGIDSPKQGLSPYLLLF